MKQLFWIAAIFLLVISCKKKEHKLAPLGTMNIKVLDSVYAIEKPKWWDNTEIWIIDSLLKKSESHRAYLSLLTRDNYDLFREKYSSDIERKRHYFKSLIYFYSIGKNSFDDVLFEARYSGSYKLEAQLREIRFNTNKEKYLYYEAEKIGELYFDAGELNKAKKYYHKAKELALKKTKIELENINKSIAKIEAIDNPRQFIKEKQMFIRTLDSIIVNIGDLKTDKYLNKLDGLSKGYFEKKFSELNISNKEMLKNASVLELALTLLVVEKRETIITKELIEEVRQSFKDFNLIEHDDFEVNISGASLYRFDRDEWILSFWATGDIGGLAVANFKGMEFKGIDMVD